MFSEDLWVTMDELSTELGKTNKWIDKKLIAGKLKPSIILPDINLRKIIKCDFDITGPYIIESERVYLSGGLYYINGYSNLRWESQNDGMEYIDLLRKNIFLSIDDSDEQYELVDSFKILKNEIVFAAKEVKRFMIEHGLKDKSTEPVKESTRVIENLQKMLVVMAMGGYRYDPTAKRNETLNDIRKDFEEAGLSITDNTIRKHLQAGAQLIEKK